MTLELSSHLQEISHGADGIAPNEKSNVTQKRDLQFSSPDRQATVPNFDTGSSKKGAKDVDGDDSVGCASGVTHATKKPVDPSIHGYAMRRCTLTCCAPDGSPLQGTLNYFTCIQCSDIFC